MADFDADPHAVFAAAHGSCDAQRDLAAQLLAYAESIAEDNPDLAAEYLMGAEAMAELAATNRDPLSAATLGAVLAIRSLHSPFDPVRAVDFRDRAERLFDAVEQSRDTRALATIGVALNRLADAEDADDRAALRLARVVAALPPGEACLLRAVARPPRCEPQDDIADNGA